MDVSDAEMLPVGAGVGVGVSVGVEVGTGVGVGVSVGVEVGIGVDVGHLAVSIQSLDQFRRHHLRRMALEFVLVLKWVLAWT